MNVRLTAVTAIAIAALMGCAATPAESAPSPSETQASATPTPSAASPSAASVTQWASKIAESAPDWKRSAETFHDDCSWIAIALGGEGGLCGVQVITMSAIGATIPLTVSNATRDLGAPPAEIEDLVARLNSAGIELQEAADAVPAACPDAGDKKCATKWIRTERAANELVQILNGWSPYL